MRLISDNCLDSRRYDLRTPPVGISPTGLVAQVVVGIYEREDLRRTVSGCHHWHEPSPMECRKKGETSQGRGCCCRIYSRGSDRGSEECSLKRICLDKRTQDRKSVV